MVELLPFAIPKSKTKIFLMADYLELLCFCNPDNEISLDDALMAVYHSAESEAERELRVEETSIEETDAEFNDRQRTNAEDWFRQLVFRRDAFGEFYPFSVSERLLVRRESITAQMKIYIFLLLCSSLRIIKETCRNSLTTYFEILSAGALEKYLPAFTVHPFGKSTAAREHYPNKLYEAIDTLCCNLKERNICNPLDIRDKNTGDGGLDIVAWRSLNDYDTPANLICFAQCACSPDEWEEKPYDIDSDKWQRRISFIHPPTKIIFIPICFRSADGSWFNLWNIGAVIIMDRLRICWLIDTVRPEFNDLMKIADEFMEVTASDCPE